MALGTKRTDLDFLKESEAAIRDTPPRISTLFLFGCVALFAAALTWAHYAQIEEVTRGEGKVIPSSKAQVLQSLEGGIVKRIFVREGDKVSKGQVVVRMDSTRFSSDLGELRAKERVLVAQADRLGFEASGADGAPSFSEGALKDNISVVDSERDLFKIRQRNLRNQIEILKDRHAQRNQELAELRATRKSLKVSLDIARRERAIKSPLARSGIVSKTDVLKLDREISDLRGQLATTLQSIPRVEASIREALNIIEEQRLTFRQTAQTERNTKLAELAIVQQSIKAAVDRFERTELRSPVAGLVNKIYLNTIGGVLKAGEPLLVITPLDDTLFAEVRVDPKDIAFILPGQRATVKLSAYDYTIYGVLEGSVEVISSDSLFDELTKQSYYLITIRTKESSLRKGKEVLPIIPGMIATADIITGKKSVLEYLLKPMFKARNEALRER